MPLLTPAWSRYCRCPTGEALLLPCRGVLILGNFLSGSQHIRMVSEDLAHQLATSGWLVLTASDKEGRLARLADMVTTVWSRRHQYAVAQVAVYSGSAFLWAEAVCWALRRAGRRYILTLHGGYLPSFGRRWPRRMRQLLSSATVVTAPSRYLVEQMRPYREGIRLLPNSMVVDEYPFRVRKHPLPHLMWLRAFHANYNPSLAPKVLARLAPSFPDVRVTMIGPNKGDGSLRAMQEVASRLNVAGRMTIIGGVAKTTVGGWMGQADIFLNTTNVDNAPISVLEAMASGLCVISTNVGGIPYMLEHERDALLVPPDDAEAMAAAVRRVLTEPGLAESLSRNARRKAERSNWSVILPKWEALLTAVAEGRQP